MKRTLDALVAALLLAGVMVAAGCGSSPAPSTTESVTTVSITTTTTEPPASWTRVEVQGATPSARCYHAMVYDSTFGNVFMFGGSDGTVSLEETWVYDAVAGSWSDLQPEGEEQPTAARQMSGAYDPTSLTIVTFDGTSWGYDVQGNEWWALGPKGDRLTPARYGASIVKDEKSGKVVLFGGTDMNESYDETWSYDPGENAWTKLEFEGEVPPGRSDAGMAYDPGIGKIVLFGGVDSDFNCLDDTWLYDSAENSWTRLTTTAPPAARSGLGLVYDRHSKRVILFGGIDSQLACYNDTWMLDTKVGTWTELSQTGELPMARGRMSLVYVPEIDKVVLFGGATVQADAGGGFGALVCLDDMWVYGVGSATNVDTTQVPTTALETSTTQAGANEETTSTAE